MAEGGVIRETLENGLTVLVKPNTAASVVAIVTLIKAGYYDEPDALTGIAHLLEHMFFKGTPTRGVGEMARETKALGGYLNAGTIYDRTSYYTVLPADKWREGLEIQADALLHATLDPNEFEREKQVVIEEIRRKYDSPSAMAWEQMVEGLFSVHRTRRWRMGQPEQVAAFSHDQLLQFYRNYYRPNNAVLVVVGDVNPPEVLDRVRTLYGTMEGGPVGSDRGPEEPPRRAWSWRQDTADIGKAQLVIGFPCERFDHAQTAPLTVLATVLGQGRSSRLYQQLKEYHRLVLDISTDLYANSQVGIFTIAAEVEPAHLVEAEGAIFGEISRIATHDIHEVELDKARHMIEASYIAELSSMDGQANMLAEHEAFATYDFAEKWLAMLRRVTAEEVRAAARHYLDLARASVFEYWPAGTADGAGADQRRGQIEAGRTAYMIANPVPAVSDDWAARPEFAIPPKRDDSPVTTYPLVGGGTLIARENHALPTCSVGIYFRGGRLHEEDANAGITRLLLDVGMKGTSRYSASRISQEFERIGAMLAPSVSSDYFGYFATFLARTASYGIELMFDVVGDPVFPEAELAKEKEVLKAEAETRRDNMFAHPLDLFNAVLYPGHGYGLPQPGSLDSLGGLARETVVSWRDRFLRRNKLIFVAVGDFDSDALAGRLDSALAYILPAGGDSEAPPIPHQQAGEQVVDRKRAQSALIVGFPTVPYDHADYCALKILQGVASGMGGRLFVELRDRRALAYSVFAAATGKRLSGSFYAYIATSPDKEEEARRALLAELGRFKDEPISTQELAEAKSYLIGNFLIGLQTNPAQAGLYARYAALGMTPDELDAYPQRLRAVSAEDVQRVARTYFDPSRLGCGVVRGQSA